MGGSSIQISLPPPADEPAGRCSSYHRRVRTFVLLAALAFVSCDGATTPSYGLNQEFTLAPGGAATVTGTAVRIVFDGVAGDSRCPADAVCIQGGDALVKITVRSPGDSARQYELHTGNLQPVSHDGLTIALVQLQPYPFSSRTIAPEDYRATLIVN